MPRCENARARIACVGASARRAGEAVDFVDAALSFRAGFQLNARAGDDSYAKLMTCSRRAGNVGAPKSSVRLVA